MTTPALPRESIDSAIAAFQNQQIGTIELAERILSAPNDQSSPTVRLDLDRHRRCGFPEVIFAQGKSVDHLIAAIDGQLDSLAGTNQRIQSVFVTRIDVEQARHVAERFAHVAWDSISRTLRVGINDEGLQNIKQESVDVNVICAGTADMPVALEAQATLDWMGVSNRLIADVGVAGLHRLLGQLTHLREAKVNIVVAGMEGALPSVVGGLIRTPVIACPTSVGYGANFNGLSALLSMINSCSANVCVVNIDAGFKAGYVAGLMVQS
jgi:pyridinium-3,5-biscarboxylic acid mononucleotide synthase